METKIIRSDRKTLSVEVKPEGVIVRVPMAATDRDIDRFLRRHKAWIDEHLERVRQETAASDRKKLSVQELEELKQKARELIPERVAYYAELIGVTYGRITIRCQRTRWGSCGAKGDLNFNCLLMLMPPEILDSVVVHELCHRKEMNHSEKFYGELLRVFPDYRRCEKWLKNNGRSYINMLP